MTPRSFTYDELEAFIRRNGQVGAAAIRSAGETYAAGGASVEQSIRNR